MSEEANDRDFLRLWTWIFVAVSSAGYAAVNLLSSTPAEAEGLSGAVQYLAEVALPIGLCAAAAWFGIEAWRR